MADEASLDQAAITRRNALKAAAAAGVGAAAFAGPQIGILGSTPAYAQACSAPFTIAASSSCENVSCNCQPGNTAGYDAPSVNPISGTYAGGSFSATVNPGCGATVDLDVTGPIQCRLTVRVYNKNGGGDSCTSDASNTDMIGQGGLIALESTGGVLESDGTTNLTIPVATCPSGGSIFSKYVVECTTDVNTPNCM